MLQLLVALFFCAFASLPEQEEGVYVLGEDNFDDFISAHEHVLVEFYAPWCGHCKALAPAYSEAAQTLASEGSSVKLAKVDATVHQALGQRFQLQGYPTIKFFRSGNPSDYEGGRSAKEIVLWVTKKSGPSSTELSTQEAIDAFKAKDETVVIAFTKPGANLDSWLAATKDPRFDDFSVGHVLDEALWGGNKEGVVLYKKGDDSVSFEGFAQPDLNNWISIEGFPLVEELAQQIWVRSQKTQTPLLAVFHEETDTATKDLLFKVAKANKGKALFSWSNRIQILEQWGGSGKKLPSAIMVQWHGEDPKFKVWNEDSGLIFDEANLNAFISETLAGTYVGYKKSEPIPETNEGPVLTLVGKNFEEHVFVPGRTTFVEFYAPWCGHCKKLAPIWDELAAKTKTTHPDLVIAKIDASANGLPDGIDVQGFPTIILFQERKQTPYTGARDLEAFQTWLDSILGGEKAEL